MVTSDEPPSPGSERRLRVLVVEDESLLSLSLEAMLEDWGHEQVGSVPTGAQAIRLTREQSPDVVLMDINLIGGMDGITAASEIRGFSETRIIFMTAYSDRDLASRPELADAPLLHKPFSPRRLRELLDAIRPDRNGSASPGSRRPGHGNDNGADQGC